MMFFRENLRLGELVAIVKSNEDFFRDFLLFLKEKGYSNVQDFMQEDDDELAFDVLSQSLSDGSPRRPKTVQIGPFEYTKKRKTGTFGCPDIVAIEPSDTPQYLRRRSNVTLYDGLLRPYEDTKARWYFLAWLMRDAPAQRLNPMLSSVPGKDVNERRAYLLNEIRKFVAPLFPKPESWEWAAVAEVMLARLEGSRRALKGTLFEGIIRRNLTTLFESEGLPLSVNDKEVRIGGETYDVRVDGQRGTILLPVKTRETMGGGHALLFTRDIFKAIGVAKENGYGCIPVVIAESWTGNLDALSSEHYVWVRANPNEITRIEPELADKLARLVSVFRGIA